MKKQPQQPTAQGLKADSDTKTRTQAVAENAVPELRVAGGVNVLLRFPDLVWIRSSFICICF